MLNVTGTAELAGAMQVTLVDGFVPDLGSTFAVVTATDLNGRFEEVEFLGASSYDLDYVDGQVIRSNIVPIPEPSTLVLLSMGTLALLACAWRRRRAA